MLLELGTLLRPFNVGGYEWLVREEEGLVFQKLGKYIHLLRTVKL